MRLRRLIYLLLLLLPLAATANGTAKENPTGGTAKNSAVIDAVNGVVDRLEERILKRDKNLPSLNSEYDFHDATEGVPPSFKCYFETEKTEKSEPTILRACKVHVGHEVYSVDHIYYFDEASRPMKYLVVSSGISGEGGMPASRKGIIYDKSGRIVWSSTGVSAPMTFKEVKAVFTALNGALGKF